MKDGGWRDERSTFEVTGKRRNGEEEQRKSSRKERKDHKKREQENTKQILRLNLRMTVEGNALSVLGLRSGQDWLSVPGSGQALRSALRLLLSA